MNYSKPEVVVVTAALAVIQGVEPKDSIVLDNNGSGKHNASVGAYEADE